ncbi:hypothetical protein SPBRAN_1187 [uncultured Candidatus Thioglobus sp.]|nr:hypothetical protein SPBRAN_1187 [uncultured Candidatus Thioglobus sp.]
MIPVFDPGLSEDSANYEEDGVWPELRRAEANRFSYKMKQALDSSRAFGAVRIVPDSTASGDLYVLGKIEKSNGVKLALKLRVVDISGKKWLEKTFRYTVPDGFYKNRRNAGKDPYDPLFQEAVAAIIAKLQTRSHADLRDLQDITRLRFAASFNQSEFLEYLKINGDRFSIVSKPADDDPALQRIAAIRVREQLFMDNFQQNYMSFAEQMDESYLKWQEASFTEQKLSAKARKKSFMQAVGGALLLGLSVAAAVQSEDSSNPNVVLATAAIGGVAGAWMLSNSFKSREEAKLHKEAIDELGESLDLELGPQVISFAEETVELTGNVQQQFMQWREFLQRIYAQEAVPNTQL